LQHSYLLLGSPSVDGAGHTHMKDEEYVEGFGGETCNREKT